MLRRSVKVGELVAVAADSARFGVQVESTSEVRSTLQRFKSAGVEPTTEDATTCCYAVQDIVGSIDPVGQKWEVFVVQYAGTKRANYANSGCCSLELASLFLYGYDLISIEAQQAHEAVARRSDQHAVVATDTRPHRLMQ